MFDVFQKKNFSLFKALVRTDFKLRYQQNVIGYLWSILNPLMQFAIMYLVFVKFLRFGAGIPHFAVAMLLGIVIWTFFDEATHRSIGVVVWRGGLLRKMDFSKPIIVFSEIAMAAINFGINLVVVFIFMIINGVRPSWSLLLIIPLVLELMLLTAGISFIIATVYVKFRDLEIIWNLALQLGFYLTPIIYPLSQLQDMSPTLLKIFLLNPMAQIITDFRAAMIGFDGGTYQYMMDYILLYKPIALIPYVFSVVIFVAGFLIYNAKSQDFAEVI
ncbi:MAG: ABC transporter permease [Streptococcaceae bacterium]|nr:ABC transporter permease [Streptococcaceae bacterium]